jgi:hypothetical protein
MEDGTTLGSFKISVQKFEGLPALLKEFRTAEFKALRSQEKSERVNRSLFNLIVQAKSPCFLLPAVLDYIEQMNAQGILDSYAFYHFELWLNQFSKIGKEENAEARAKIAGKRVPRDAFQTLFPIGMGKVYPGSHYVTAHSSPDLDTTVASFWGWVDAFTARVSDGLHLWNLPGGAPMHQVEISILFNHIFGDGVFHHLAKTRTALTLSGIDLMTQKGVAYKLPNELTRMVDHERAEHAVILVDPEGYYLGDWRSFDVEGVRQVVVMFNHCLRWFEKHLHVKIVALFAKPTLTSGELSSFFKEIFLKKLGDFNPVKDITEKQRKHLQDYLVKVLGVKKGLEGTFEEFAQALKNLGLSAIQEFIASAQAAPPASLFDKSGAFVENRAIIFNYLGELFQGLDAAIHPVRDYVDRLDVALDIKKNVFGYHPQFISYRDEVDEIKSKMGSYTYLSVTSRDKEGKLTPLGIVSSNVLHKTILGTVTLRDFCNREETKIPSYFEVISVIDHHKSSLQTSSVPVALIADTQSSNVLCAEMAFAINDRYGTGGMSKQQVDAQVAELLKDLSSLKNKRLMNRLIQKQLSSQEGQNFFIDPTREAVEYLHFLYGILDDTDLLTKVSKRDLECVAQLINRLKSLFLQKEVEVLSLGDLPSNQDFAALAARRILQNEDMYSLYRKIYLSKEEAAEESILSCASGETTSFFVDTKEQNGFARVGQMKIFSRNYPAFEKHLAQLRSRWYASILDFVQDKPEIDLHMQMISTIAGAEDLFAGSNAEYAHQDELWIWIPFTEQSIEHLKGFLNAFRSSPQLQKDGLSVEYYGDKAREYDQIFTESFLQIPKKVVTAPGKLSIAVLKYKAGLINSRKAMISPYLPK